MPKADGTIQAPAAPPQMPGVPQMPQMPQPAAAPITPAVPAMPSVEELQAQLFAAQQAAAQAAIAQQPVAPVTPQPQFPTPAMPQMPQMPAAPQAPQGPSTPIAPQMPQVAAPPLPPVNTQANTAPAMPAAPQVQLPVAPTVAPQQTPASPLGNLSQMMDQARPAGSGGLFDRFRSINVAGIESNNFRLLPLEIPLYEGRIVKCEMGTSSTNLPQLVITVKTYYPGPHAGVSIKTWITLQPDQNKNWVWKSLLEATGFCGPQGECLAENASDFVGRCVGFQIKHDPWDGALRNKIAGGFSVAQFIDEVPAVEFSIPQPAFAGAAG